MDPVNGLSQIVQILRQKLAERSTTANRLQSSPAAGLDTGKKTATKESLEDIKRKIGERIKALPTDEAGESRAAQLFVEIVMTWEFGEQLLQDPQFSALSKEIALTITEHPKIGRSLRQLLQDFRSS